MNFTTRAIASLAGLSALYFAWDSYQTNAPNRRAAQQANLWNSYQDRFVYSTARYSGNNAMDQGAVRFHNVVRHARDWWKNTQIQAAGVYRDLIEQNFGLLAVATAGIGIGMGDHIGRMGRSIWRIVSPALTHLYDHFILFADRHNLMGRTGQWIANRLVNVAQWTGNNPLPAALMLLTGGLLANRFKNVVTGEAEQSNFHRMTESGKMGNLYGNPFTQPYRF